MLIIKNEKEAAKVRRGDQFFIDVYPDPPVTDSEISSYPADFEKAQQLDSILSEIVNESLDLDVCPVQIPEGRRWFESEVTVAIDPSLPRADQVHLKKCFEVHQKWVAKNSALTHSIIANYNSAKIKITKGPIDGRNGTLAQAELRIQTQQDRIISVTVRFDEEDGTDHFTGLHEFCHADGVAHQTTDPEGLMYPSKNNATYYGEYELGEYGTKYPKQKLA